MLTFDMNGRTFLLSTLILFTAAGAARATGSLSVTETQYLNASPAKVWSVVGDFATLNTWHPEVVSEKVNGAGDAPGAVRVLKLGNGGTITERLVSRDSAGMKYSYVMLSSPLPVSHYESTIKVVARGHGGCMFIWSSSFDPRGVTKTQAMKAISDVYAAGTEALAKRFH